MQITFVSRWSGRFNRLFLAAMISVATAVSAVAAPGDLDDTFGKRGRVFTGIPRPAGFETFYPNAESMLVQPDGRILVCGRFWEDLVSYWYGTFIVRYMPDGTLDPSFGTSGIVAAIEPRYPYGGNAIGADMVLQPDGRIVLIGQLTIARGIIVQRYTSTGEIDTTFGDGGSTIVRGKVFSEGSSVAIQPDGKIVGIGWDFDWQAKPYYDAILLFRLHADGSPDRSFGPDGNGKLFIEHGYDGAQVLIQPDGRIVVAGIYHVATKVPPTILVARFNSDGSPDSSFGTDGRALHRDDTTSHMADAALQPDGKIVVADTGGSMIRFDSNGAPDDRFGKDGVAPFASGFVAAAVLIQTDGRIIAVGNVRNATTSRSDFAVIRLNSDGSTDSRFGTDGKSVHSMNTGGTNFASAWVAARQPDGNIVVAGVFGHYYTDSHESIAIARFLSPTPRARPVRPSGQ